MNHEDDDNGDDDVNREVDDIDCDDADEGKNGDDDCGTLLRIIMMKRSAYGLRMYDGDDQTYTKITMTKR